MTNSKVLVVACGDRAANGLGAVSDGFGHGQELLDDAGAYFYRGASDDVREGLLLVGFRPGEA